MRCPQCGYSIGEFEVECARCAAFRRRTGHLPEAPAPAFTTARMQTVRPAAPAIRCLACGQPLDVSAETCIACGRVLPPHASAGRHAVTAARPYESFGRPRIQVQSGTHSVTLAILLGFFMTGTGQMANKQLAKGITLLIAAVLLAVPTIGMGAVIVWLVAFIDAICVANRLNRGEPITEWTWF